MDYVREFHSCACFNNKIYVMGGSGPENPMPTVIYDIISGKWSDFDGTDTDLPWTGLDMHAVVYEDVLYVAGGDGSNGKIWKLNSAGTGWDPIATTAHNTGRKFFPAQVIKSDSCLPGKAKSKNLAHLYL